MLDACNICGGDGSTCAAADTPLLRTQSAFGFEGQALPLNVTVISRDVPQRDGGFETMNITIDSVPLAAILSPATRGSCDATCTWSVQPADAASGPLPRRRC